MAKKIADKLAQKRQVLVERTARALGVEESRAVELLSIGRVQSVRINPLKANTSTLEAMKQLGWNGVQFGWFKDGYTIESGLQELRDSDLVATGQIYIQNAASWLPVLALDPQPGERILDMCSAPGGKASHIAAHANNQVHITANDNSRPRLAKLRANMERLGAENIEYTLYDASQIARKLEGRQFDKILLDAPCSGEGMMNYQNDKDFATWSVAHIKRLQQLQKRLITQAWQLLKPGGTLVYSTCTIAPEENEAVIDFLLRKNPDAEVVPFDVSLPNRIHPVSIWNGKTFDPRTQQALRLAPGQVTEAFYVYGLRRGRGRYTILNPDANP